MLCMLPALQLVQPSRIACLGPGPFESCSPSLCAAETTHSATCDHSSFLHCLLLLLPLLVHPPSLLSTLPALESCFLTASSLLLLHSPRSLYFAIMSFARMAATGALRSARSLTSFPRQVPAAVSAFHTASKRFQSAGGQVKISPDEGMRPHSYPGPSLLLCSARSTFFFFWEKQQC